MFYKPSCETWKCELLPVLLLSVNPPQAPDTSHTVLGTNIETFSCYLPGISVLSKPCPSLPLHHWIRTLLCCVPITQHMTVKPLLWKFRLLVWAVGSSNVLVFVRVEGEQCSAEHLCYCLYPFLHLLCLEVNEIHSPTSPAQGQVGKKCRISACRVSFVILMEPCLVLSCFL